MTAPRPLLSDYPVYPWAELGIGDTRAPTGQAVWDTARWDNPAARWASTEPTWLDVSCEVNAAHSDTGRERMTDRFRPGTADVTLRNLDGWADLKPPPHPPATLVLRPGRQLRYGVDTATGRHVLWRGYIDEAIPLYQPWATDVVVVNGIDAAGEVGRAQLAAVAAVGAGENVTAHVTRILDAAGWPTTYRSIDPASTPLQATTLGAGVADLLGVAADSAGGAVFGDLTGRVAYRARDWQTYMPGTPPAAIVGNVDPGVPGYWIPGTPAVPAVPGYLTPAVARVTAPDDADLRITADTTWVARVRLGDLADTVTHVIACQRPQGAANLAWQLARQNGPALTLRVSVNGTSFTQTGTLPGGSLTAVASGDTVTVAFSIDMDNGAGGHTITYRLLIGSTWTVIGTATVTGALTALFDSAALLAIGGYSNATQQWWDDRLYWVEQRTGLDPAAGTVVWRFTADDYPGTGLTFTDPRGRVWTQGVAGAITPMVPMVPAVPPVWMPPVPGDVCPSTWELSWRRRDVAAVVTMGRGDGVAVTVVDQAAQTAIGPEPFVRSDLLTANSTDLDLLARRLLVTRGMGTMPRVEAVTLDAATDPGDGSVVELMASARPETPTRIRCRLRTHEGRDVFDVEMFVTAVEHTITDTGRWFCRLTLDVAAPWQAAGGRWDQAATWDHALWANAVTAARTLLARMEEVRS